MLIEPGRTLLHYRLVERIGEGGMGVVWRAADTDLDREVAIKILPEAFAAAGDRLARFEREAKLLASLSHPNIAILHGLHAVDATRFLVMELLPGEDLQKRMDRGHVPLDEAVEITRQIATALEAAHERGIVHRDLKPANVIVGPDGTVKVVDFGLAKSQDPDAADSGLSHSPTMTHAATSAGMILGTAGYMAPEQAKGKVVDRRADIWAFGVLLYELLTTSRLYEKETVSEALAAVLLEEPTWERLPAETPSHLVRLLRRCLTKDPRQRLRDIGEARIVLEGSLTEETAPRDQPETSTHRVGTLAVVVVLGVGLLVGFGLARLLSRGSATPAPAEPRHASVIAPEDVVAISSPTLSADGRSIVYQGSTSDSQMLYQRDLTTGLTTAIRGTEDGTTPFLSPDGRWIGYFAGDKMKKVSASGSDALEITRITRGSPGAAWLSDGTILYSAGWLTGLSRISDDGGAPEALTTPNAAAGEIGHWWPEPLPDGRHVLFTVWTAGSGLNDARIAVLDLENRTWTSLVQGARAKFAAPDRLIFYRAGTYQFVRFDPASRKLLGDPVPLDLPIEKQYPHGNNRDKLSLGPGGMLIYVPGDSLFARRRIVRIDRSGAVTPLVDVDYPIRDLDLSPDGRMLATSEFGEGRFSLVVTNLERGTREQLALEGSAFEPLWVPDGSRLAFATLRTGNFDVYTVRADGSDERPLLVGDNDETPVGWFRDDNRMLANSSGGPLGSPLMLLDVETNEQTVFVPSESRGSLEMLSPDDRWIAFGDKSSGRSEVYVQRVEGSGPRIRISSNGGAEPLWCPSSDELFFWRGTVVIAVKYSVDGGRLVPSTERELFRAKPLQGTTNRTWDVAPDCDSFVVLQPGDDAPSRPEIRLVYDW